MTPKICVISLMRLLLLAVWAFAGASSFTVKPRESLVRSHSGSMCSSRLNMERRHFLGSILAGTSFLLPPFSPAQARGLVQFPCSELGNTYHFIRAGESLMEADDIWSTNPLFLTNRVDNALSEEGTRQVEETCRQALKDVNPTIVMYSLAASAMDTANIIGRELRIGRDRLVPEFTYLDPRAIGKYDMLPMASTQAAMWAMDNDEAGADGRGARPPPNEDGTPNETLDNQCTRLRQLFSLMETQYSGDTVILVFPDGTGPALLSCMIAGIPLNRVHELNYKPGEIRLDINMKSTRALLNSGAILANDYKATLAEGRQELKRLRSIKPEDLISVKDQKLEEDRLEMEVAAKQRETKRMAKDKQDHEAREARAREIEQDRQKRLEAKSLSGDENGDTSPVLMVAGAIGASAAGALLSSGGSEDGKEVISAETVEGANETAVLVSDAGPGIEMKERPMLDILDIGTQGEPIQRNDDDSRQRTRFAPVNETDAFLPVGSISGENATEPTMQRVNGDRQATFPPPRKSRDPVKAAEEAMKEYMESDDGGSEWLEMMSDLMLEEDEDEKDEPSKGLRP